MGREAKGKKRCIVECYLKGRERKRRMRKKTKKRGVMKTGEENAEKGRGKGSYEDVKKKGRGAGRRREGLM